jgi:Ca2+-binding RTX toxin-like protein
MTYGIEQALAAWAAVANVQFTLVADSATVAGDIRFGTTSAFDTYAHSYLPNPSAYAGDVWFGTWDSENRATLNDSVPGGYGYVTFMHEMGHALGLIHPHESSIYPEEFDVRDYSVMSYLDYPGQDPNDPVVANLFPTTPMLADIAAIQYLYGPNMSWASGPDTYTWDAGEKIFETIWDAGGQDTIDWSGHLDAALINLNPGEWSLIGPARDNGPETLKENLMIAYGVTIEDAAGGSGNDTLLGNPAHNDLVGGFGADSILGNAGNDELQGNQGADTLRGGLGDDVLRGGQDNDYIYSGQGADQVFGAFGNDELRGGLGADTISAGNGNDTLFGGADDDFLQSRLGNDVVTGGAGADIYWFNAAGPADADTIVDFEPNVDSIALDSTAFTAQTPGVNVLYSPGTGELTYDADGAGGAAALVIVTLQGAPAITAEAIFFV